jgi:hypothetical protein
MRSLSMKRPAMLVYSSQRPLASEAISIWTDLYSFRLLIGKILPSSIFDYVARQKLGSTHMTFFHLYGIARDDVDYLMDTFHGWREKEEKLCGEYRTKRVL